MSDYLSKFTQICEQQLEAIPTFGLGQGLQLDNHQSDAMLEAWDALTDGDRAFSVVHSCGSGKTVLEANLVIASQRAKESLGINGESKDLIVTTERALIHSIRDELHGLGLDVGVWGGGKKQIDNHPVVLATIQSLQANRKKLGRLIPLEKTHLLIGDEADKYLTKARKEILSRFREAIMVGLTATPSWPDGRDISDLWGEKIHHMPLKEGILRGINVPPLFYLFEAALDDSQLKITGGDYDAKTLAAAMKEAEIQKAVPEVYETLVPSEQRKNFPTLVYVPSVSLAKEVAQNLRDRYSGQGVIVQAWTGDSINNTGMKSDIEEFNNGKLDILVLCEMGGRGVNLPRARCIIDAYPTLSPTKLEQRHGRVLRRVREEGELYQTGFRKNFALVAQIAPQANRFRPYLLPDLLDCWDDFRAGRILGAADRKTGKGYGDEGAPIQAEVNRLRKHIESQRPVHHVQMVRKIDVYEQLKLRDDLPQADEDGFFKRLEGDGEKEVKYGAISAWANELSISATIITSKLNNTKYIFGKLLNGQIRKFYIEGDVRKACIDHLQDYPQADENGFFVIVSGDGDTQKEVRYGTISAWERELVISFKRIKRITKTLENIEGKRINGQIAKFFAENDIYEALGIPLEELPLEDLPQADEDEFFVIVTGEGNDQKEAKYGTIIAWKRELNIRVRKIKNITKKLKSIKGRRISGKTAWFFEENDVRGALNNPLENLPLEDLPQAEKDGFFVLREGEGVQKKDVRYGTREAWGREINASVSTISERLKNVIGCSGKDAGGRTWTFFAESDVLTTCADLLQNLPKSDGSGFFVKLEGEGEEKKEVRYGTKNAWMRELGISTKGITARLKNYKGISGTDSRGRRLENKFFAEIDVRTVCADLINKNYQADEKGFFVKLEGEGEKKKEVRYGTRFAWAKKYDIPFSTVCNRLEHAQGITGKDINNRKHQNAFFSESVFLNLCSDLIRDLPQADKNGFFTLSVEDKSEIFGSIPAWKNKYLISEKIRMRLRDAEGIDGKNSNGKIWENAFFSQSEVLRLCADLIVDYPRANKKGFFTITEEVNGEEKEVTYGVIGAWSKIIPVTGPTIKNRLKNKEGINGVDGRGKIREKAFYTEQDVCEACKDLLEKRKNK